MNKYAPSILICYTKAIQEDMGCGQPGQLFLKREKDVQQLSANRRRARPIPNKPHKVSEDFEFGWFHQNRKK
jgi:hypothetical protein